MHVCTVEASAVQARDLHTCRALTTEYACCRAVSCCVQGPKQPERYQLAPPEPHQHSRQTLMLPQQVGFNTGGAAPREQTSVRTICSSHSCWAVMRGLHKLQHACGATDRKRSCYG